MTAPTIDRPAQRRKPLSPWARWLLVLFLPIGIGLPVASYLIGLAAATHAG